MTTMRHMFTTRSCAQQRLILAFSLLSASLAGSVAADSPQLAKASHIDAGRLQANLDHLSEIGRDPAGGISRLGLSQAELDAHRYAVDLMKGAGLNVRIDAAGTFLAGARARRSCQYYCSVRISIRYRTAEHTTARSARSVR